MTKLIYAALLVLFLAPMTFAEDPKTETPEAEAPKADTTKANTPEVANPECEEIQAQLKEAKVVHDADYRAKGKAFNNWRKYNKELHSMSYEATDEPLLDSVKKCETDENLGKDFCKGVMKMYNEISPKEEAAKEKLTAAEAKSKESKTNYNILLRQAYEMNCLVNR